MNTFFRIELFQHFKYIWFENYFVLKFTYSIPHSASSYLNETMLNKMRQHKNNPTLAIIAIIMENIGIVDMYYYQSRTDMKITNSVCSISSGRCISCVIHRILDSQSNVQFSGFVCAISKKQVQHWTAYENRVFVSLSEEQNMNVYF